MASSVKTQNVDIRGGRKEYPKVKHFFYAIVKRLTPKAITLRPRAIILRTGAGRGHFRCL